MSAPPPPESGVTYGEDGKIAGVTFLKLVEKLSSPKDLDPALMSITLLTYRSFTSSFALCDALKERFEKFRKQRSRTATVVLLRVLNVFKHWIEKFWFDFSKDCPQLGEIFIEWVNTLLADRDVAQVAQQLKMSVRDKMANSPDTKFGSKAPPVFDPVKSALDDPASRYNDVTEIPSEELARQLTLQEYDIFRKIQPYELLNQAWTKEDAAEKSPNVITSIAYFNNISNWVKTSILLVEDRKKRIKTMQKFLEVANVMMKTLSNFNGMVSIFAAMQAGPISRLHRTSEKIGKYHEKILDALNELYQGEANFKRLRSLVKPPCIPYLGMHLKDMIFIEEGNPDMLGPNLINFAKRRLVSETIQTIKVYQNTRYDIQPDHSIRSMINSRMSVTLSEDEMWECSYYLEPREGKPRPPRPKVFGPKRHDRATSDSSGSGGQKITKLGKTKKSKSANVLEKAQLKTKDRSYTVGGVQPSESQLRPIQPPTTHETEHYLMLIEWKDEKRRLKVPKRKAVSVHMLLANVREFLKIDMPTDKLRFEYLDPEFKEYTTLDSIRDLPYKSKVRIVIPDTRVFSQGRKNLHLMQLQEEVEVLRTAVKKRRQPPPLSAPDRESPLAHPHDKRTRQVPTRKRAAVRPLSFSMFCNEVLEHEDRILKEWFRMVNSSRSGKIDAKELAAATWPGESRFDLSTCLRLASVFGRHGTKLLGFSEFAALNKYIAHLWTPFHNNDKRKTRALGRENIIHALKELGFTKMGDQCIFPNLKKHHLDEHGDVNFSGFVCLVTKMAYLGTLFDKLPRKTNPETAEITLPELVQLVAQFRECKDLGVWHSGH